ncbi:MAG: hypothetical protein AAB597_03340 [Patescibacteria group bacterium]
MWWCSLLKPLNFSNPVLGYLKDVQKYPESSKKRIALFLATILTGILIVIWLLFLSPWKKESVNFGTYEYNPEGSNVPGPIESVGRVVSEAYSGASDYAQEVGGILNFLK